MASPRGCTPVHSHQHGAIRRSEPTCRIPRAFLRSMETLLPALDREGVSVAIEPHPWDFVETTKAAVDLVHAVGSPRLSYLHCVPHTYYLGGSAAEQIAYASGCFDHAHVADTYRPERTIVNPPGLQSRIHQHFDIGRAEVDWAQTAKAFRTARFDGILTVQVFGWTNGLRIPSGSTAMRRSGSSVRQKGGGKVGLPWDPDGDLLPDAVSRTSVSPIQRALRAIEVLAADSLTAAEVARELDVNRSTALRLLAELVITGYVARDPATKRYATVPVQILRPGRPERAACGLEPAHRPGPVSHS